MDASTVALLNALNRRFYSAWAAAFDAKRRAAWPGWERVGELVAGAGRATILDAGCGNARFGLDLARRLGRPIDYVGVDASVDLLHLARRRSPAAWRFAVADLVQDGLPLARPATFDLVVCFGVLHHVPGEVARRRLLEELARRVGSGGHLAVSFWRFAERERFRRRALDRAAAGALGLESLAVSQLEDDDYLLPWGPEGGMPRPLRFCHFVDRPEAERLVAGLGLANLDEFSADGREGDLNDYAILRRE